MNKNQEVEAVRLLGDKIWYGQLMTIASALWRQKLVNSGWPSSGAFVPALVFDVKDSLLKKYIKDSKHYDEYILAPQSGEKTDK